MIAHAALMVLEVGTFWVASHNANVFYWRSRKGHCGALKHHSGTDEDERSNKINKK